MKLSKSQKDRLLELISEGLETDEINARAAGHDEPFTVSRQQVDFYRKSRGVRQRAIVEASEESALKKGFARKEARVGTLNRLAEVLERELLEEGRLWVDDVKSVGSGEFAERVDLEYFNAAEVQQLRGLLDDIAKEVGDRRQKIDLEADASKALATLLGVPPSELPSDPASGNA